MSETVVYELVDGAIQTVALYSNYEAAEAHAMDAEERGGLKGGLDIMERVVHDEYVYDPRGDWRA